VLQGRALSARGAREKSLVAFERALEIDPSSSDAAIGIALALALRLDRAQSADPQRDAARAEQLLRDAMARDPGRSWAYATLGTLRRTQGRLPDALVAFQTALSLDPNDVRVIRNIGQLLNFTGNCEAAIPHLEKAIRLSPRDPGIGWGYLNLGGCHLFLGRIGQALDLKRKAVAALPQDFATHLSLAGVLGLDGDIDQAKSEIAEAVRLRPEIASVSRFREFLRSIGLVHPDWLEQMDKTVFAGLRRAGFPEE